MSACENIDGQCGASWCNCDEKRDVMPGLLAPVVSRTELRQYKDASGNPTTLDWLVKNEPEWAANQIRHRDKLDAENKTLKDTLADIANMPEYDQDDAHRLRHKAKRAIEPANE